MQRYDYKLERYIRVEDILKGVHGHDDYHPTTTYCNYKGERIHLRYTAFITWGMFLSALGCLVPVAVAYLCEMNRVNIMVGDMKNAPAFDKGMVTLLLKATDQILHSNGANIAYVTFHHLTPLLYLVAFVIVFFFLHFLFLSSFLTLPLDIVNYSFSLMHILEPGNDWTNFLLDAESPNPMREIFPTNGVCSIPLTAPSGEKKIYTSICSIDSNVTLYAMALPIWTLLVVGAVMATCTFLLHLLPLVCPPCRAWLLKRVVNQPCWDDAMNLAKRLPYCDFRFLLMLEQELLKDTFTHLVSDLSTKIQTQGRRQNQRRERETAYLESSF